jgi:predicted tellurium resistance membrane protein TerC
MEGHDDDAGAAGRALSFRMAILQIIILDIIFFLDSIVTAVGLTQFLPVMITAVVIAVIIMVFASGPVSDFIQRHPSAKMLALSFLLLVGAALVPDGMHFHIPRGFLYFAIAFSIMVEVLNLTARKRRSRKQA